jgi:formamidopyrimidine-DNA glycosylase
MPELPEVQTVVSSLTPKILGQRICSIELIRPDILHPAGIDLAEHLAGKRVEQIVRRAKRIVFTLETGNRFYIHLGMSGRLTIESPTAEIPKHTHLIVHFAKFDLRFRDPRRFGGIFWLGDQPDDDTIGPEPLSLRSTELATRLAKTTRVIKSALLDQNLIAGLGNIYVDESLFAAGIHPLMPANKLKPDQIRRLNRAIKSTLNRALRHRGSTLRDYVDAEGGSGAFQKLHRVYDRADQPCRVCKTPVSRIVIGGRSTHFCPVCQNKDS